MAASYDADRSSNSLKMSSRVALVTQAPIRSASRGRGLAGGLMGDDTPIGDHLSSIFLGDYAAA